MKLRYFIPVFAAIVALFTGCKSDDDPIYLDNIQVSTSYVSLSKDGGVTKVKLNAAGDWAFDKVIARTETNAGGEKVTNYYETPEWLTVSPLSGSAGQDIELSFSADAAAGRTATLKLSCGGQTQEINVIQGLAEVATATCAEVIAGADAKTYMVTGVCTAIANTNYGNWYINDGTGEVYIYGTVDASGKYNWASFGIEVGDEVTVQGPKTTYNGTVELVDVAVVKVNKSLIKVDSLSSKEPLPLEGGEVTAAITCKGDGIGVEIPDEAKDWLFITAVTSKSVTFRALPNTGGDRSTTVTFTTKNSGKSYSSQVEIAQTGAILEVPVTDFLAAAVGDTQYRITGVITELYASDKQGKSFYLQDYSGKTLIYRVEGFIEAGAKVGDIVTVVGKRGAYRDSPQMVEGTFEAIKYAVTEVSIADFLTKADDKNTYYMVSGTISSLLGSNGKENDYGNLYLTDGTNELYVYGTYPGYGATGDDRKFFIKNNDLKVGDKLTIIGYKDTYNGLVELCGGICFSFEKAE